MKKYPLTELFGAIYIERLTASPIQLQDYVATLKPVERHAAMYAIETAGHIRRLEQHDGSDRAIRVASLAARIRKLADYSNEVTRRDRPPEAGYDTEHWARAAQALVAVERFISWRQIAYDRTAWYTIQPDLFAPLTGSYVFDR